MLFMMARAIPKTGPRRSRLLYVQDDAESIALVEHLLACRKDLVLLRALDLEQGLKLAGAKEPEAILIDIDLPGMGAVEFMKRLRKDAATDATPILALGSNASPAAVVKAIDAGFFHYLAKPLQAAPFLEALAYALEFTALERAERGSPQPLKESR
jgi:CheY-like chemotaxis protein